MCNNLNTNLEKKGISENNPLHFISLKQFCDLTELSQSYAYKLTSTNILPHYKPFGKKIYFKIDEVQKMFEEARVSSISEHTSEAVNYVFNSQKK
jgi:excisionase family DNA binding protein